MSEKAGKKYGLILKKKPTSVQLKPSIFGGDNSDDDLDTGRKTVNLTIKKEAAKKKQMRQTQHEIDKVLEDDPTAYEYDEVYDKMAERKANLLAAKTATANKKPKYISNLLKSAEIRKKQEERRIERQVQKEREEEGNEFADKDSFVTSAFRQKMQEMAEEEERQRKQDERDGDVTKQADLSKFYRNLLDRNVSTGGSYDTMQQTKTTEGKKKGLRQSPSPEQKGHERDGNSGKEKRYFEDDEKREDCRKDRDRMREKRREHEKRDRQHEERYYEKRKHEDRELKEHEGKKNESRKHENKTHEHERRKPEHDDNDNRKYEHDDKRSEHDDGRHEHESKRLEKTRHKTEENEKSRKRSNDSDNKTDSQNEKDQLKKNEDLSSGGKKEEEKSALNKFAKHSSTETVLSARERYLARKKTRVVAVQHGSGDES